MKRFVLLLSLNFIFLPGISCRQNLQLPSWNKKSAESDGFKIVDQVRSRVGESCVLDSDIKGFEFFNDAIKKNFAASGYLPTTYFQSEALKNKAKTFKANIENNSADVEEIVKAIYFKQSQEPSFDDSKFKIWLDSLDFDIYSVADNSLFATKAFYAFYPLKSSKDDQEILKKYYKDHQDDFVKTKTYKIEISLNSSDADEKNQEIVMEPATIKFVGSEKKWIVQDVECDDKIVENLCKLKVGDKSSSFKTSSDLDCQIKLLDIKVEQDSFEDVKDEILLLVKQNERLEHFDSICNTYLKDCVVETKICDF